MTDKTDELAALHYPTLRQAIKTDLAHSLGPSPIAIALEIFLDAYESGKLQRVPDGLLTGELPMVPFTLHQCQTVLAAIISDDGLYYMNPTENTIRMAGIAKKNVNLTLAMIEAAAQEAT